jgi:plasmid stabilization system protein ParE
MRLIYHPGARADLAEAAAYYSRQQQGLGPRFVSAVETAVQEILDDPHRMQIVQGDIRRCRVHRFPYDIYFRIVGDELQIVVVKHHRRGDEFWKGRD